MKDDETKLLVSDEVARRIREAREMRGWSQYKLAEKSGVSAPHIYRIEQGFLAVRVDVLQRLCVALKLEMQFPLPI